MVIIVLRCEDVKVVFWFGDWIEVKCLIVMVMSRNLEVVEFVYKILFFVMNLYRKLFVLLVGCWNVLLKMCCGRIYKLIIMFEIVRLNIRLFMGIVKDLFW